MIVEAASFIPITAFKKPKLTVNLSNIQTNAVDCELDINVSIKIPLKQKNMLAKYTWAAAKGFEEQGGFICSGIKTEKTQYLEPSIIEQKLICKLLIAKADLFSENINNLTVSLLDSEKIIGRGRICKLVTNYKIDKIEEFDELQTKITSEKPEFQLELEDVYVEDFCWLLKEGKNISVQTQKADKVYIFYNCALLELENDFINKRLKRIKLISCRLKVE
ncbi:MAG: hypothetical protein ACI4PK_00675 [Oscillospiraceae bacterium]